MKLLLVAALLFISLTSVISKLELHPASDEFIAKINSHKSTWTAGKNFDSTTSMSKLRGLLGVKPGGKKLKPRFVTRNLYEIPESFDAREQWPDCTSIGTIRDQASCGSCWAFGAVEAMSDRVCIHSKGQKKVSISAEDLNSCCVDCGIGCEGGWLTPSWQYWAESGITTGGLYNTTDGCKAYSIEPCEHHSEGERPACGNIVPTPACVKKCDAGTNLKYDSELTFGQEPYSVLTERQIQIEIFTNGPVEAAFDVYTDFLTYKLGVYQQLEGEYEGGHAIKILGWGVENDTPYWLIANSWNNDWGDHGYFKMLRGVDHLGIESDVVAGLPRLD